LNEPTWVNIEPAIPLTEFLAKYYWEPKSTISKYGKFIKFPKRYDGL
jgi:hypothetical protein